MSSSNSTDILGLNQWIKSDIPVMEDFNGDNEVLDAVIGGHIYDEDAHLDAQQIERIAKPYDLFLYYGDGKERRTITLDFDFSPRICIVFAVSAPVGVIDIPNDTHYNYFGITTTEGGTDGLSLSGNSLSVIQGGTMVAKYEMRSYNQIGKSYLVIGIR